MIVLRTYKELEQFFLASTKSQLGLVIVESLGGLAKTTHVRKAAEDVPHEYIGGHLTPLEFYKKLYYAKDKLIIVDDVDTLWDSSVMTGLLKMAADTVPIKEVQYNTSKELEVPSSFQTRSNFIILCNRLKKMPKNMQAFLTRGVHIVFRPSVNETYEQMCTFAKDTEITHFIGNIKGFLPSLDMRKYKVAQELKGAGLDWQDYLLQELNVNKDIVAARRATEQGKNYKDRCQLFLALTGKSRRTYDRVMRLLK